VVLVWAKSTDGYLRMTFIDGSHDSSQDGMKVR